MELFEQMRREYEHVAGTIKGVAQKFGVHRRMVHEAIGNAVPKPRKIAEREKPKLAAVIPPAVNRQSSIAEQAIPNSNIPVQSGWHGP